MSGTARPIPLAPAPPPIPAPVMPLKVTPSALQQKNLPDPAIDDPFHDQEVAKGALNTPDEILYKKRAGGNAGTILETTGPLLHSEKVKKTVIYKEGLSEASSSNVGIPGIRIGTPGEIVSGAHLEYVGGFAVFYLLAYVASGFSTYGANRAIDLVFLFALVVVGLVGWSNPERATTDAKEYVLSVYSDLMSWQYAAAFLAAFYLVVYVLGVPMSVIDGKSVAISVVDSGLSVFILTQLAHLGLKYWFEVDVLSSLFASSDAPVPVPDPGIVPEPEPPSVPEPAKEVFNVANNAFTYSEAKAVCRAYDARLATYGEIEQAYNNGAEWCNYGWSNDQMIFFPTQAATWTSLQDDPAKKHSCGRPGVNGGFMANPNLKFGVNCYGVRPAFTEGTDIQQSTAHSSVPLDSASVAAAAAIKGKSAPILSFDRSKWSGAQPVPGAGV